MKIQNKVLDNNKKIIFVFKSLQGIGISKIIEIMAFIGLSIKLKMNQLLPDYFLILKRLIEDGCYFLKHFEYKKVIIGIELKKYLKQQKTKYLKNNHKKGIRLKKGLPIRGQRTCSNGKTARKFNI